MRPGDDVPYPVVQLTEIMALHNPYRISEVVRVDVPVKVDFPVAPDDAK